MVWIHHLLDSKLRVAAAAVLLDAVEHEVAAGVVVKLPRLLLEVLDRPLDGGQPGVDLPLIRLRLVLGLR